MGQRALLTDDGYLLLEIGNVWTDGDLEWPANYSGHTLIADVDKDRPDLIHRAEVIRAIAG